MFARVIPFAKLPRKLEYFDYSVPQELEDKIKIGHMVAIFFRGKKIWGAVRRLGDIAEAAPEKIKPITALGDIVLPERYVELLCSAADYYLASPAIFFKFFIPTPVASRTEPGVPAAKKMVLNKAQAERVVAALGNFLGEEKNFFFYDNDFTETAAVFIKIAEKELRKGGQVLVLVPAAEDINVLAPYFSSIFGERLVIWTGRPSAGERFSLWQKVASGGPKVILGTRPAAFLPFAGLSMILIYNCASSDLKQWDQNPRYDSREVAEKLQIVHNAKIVWSDSEPDLKIWKELSDKKISAMNGPAETPPFTIVDVKKEKGAAPLWSYQTDRMAAEALTKKQKIILFINRREKNSLLFCRDCRKIFSCPECGRPESVDNGALSCYHCRIQKPLPPQCPHCRGTNLKTLAAGAENLKKSIEKEFPEAKAAVAAKGAAQIGEFDILLATDYFWKNTLPLLRQGYEGQAKIYGAAILDFDFYLARPEFNQKESAFLALRRFLRFAANCHLQEALVQTAFPENPIFGPAETVYGHELYERRELGYPPFGRLVKIICKEKNKDLLEEESRRLYEKLVNAGFGALPPFHPALQKRTKNYLKHIIIKEDLKKDLSALKTIVPDEYQIDINPISIY